MTAGADISCSGQFDIQIGQGEFHTLGAGEINRVVIPQTIPGSNRFFQVENAVLYITDNNVNGTLANLFPPPTPPDGSLAYIVSASSPAAPAALDSAPPPAFNLPSLGSGVTMRILYRIAGAGTSRSIWVLDTTRRIFIPQGYQFAVYLVDPGDGVPHDIVGTLYAQVRWFDLT